MFKKMICIILSIVFCIAISGCDKHNDNNNNNIESNEPSLDDMLTSASVGDTIVFGKFDIDEETAGKEDLEWIVLEKKNNKLFVMSKYIVSRQRNSAPDDSFNYSWAKSDVRKWLHDEFAENAFDKESYQKILTTRVYNYKYNTLNDIEQDPTEDKIFLPAVSELVKYGMGTRGIGIHEQEKSRVAYLYNSSTPSTWFLRDTTEPEDGLCWVQETGRIIVHSAGGPDSDYGIGVRPVMWIEI